MDGTTITNDAALLTWTASSPTGLAIPPVLERIDTRTGESVWTLRLPGSTASAVVFAVTPDTTRAWLSVVDAIGRPSVVLVDLGSGARVATAAGLTPVAVPASLGGDLIARDDTGIGRYRMDDLLPVWTAATLAPGVQTGTEVLIAGETVLGLADGAVREWDDAASGGDAVVGGVLLRVTNLGAERTVARVDESTGASRWSVELSAADGLLPVSDRSVAILVDADAGELTAIDLASGEARWTVPGAVLADTPAASAAASSGAAGLVLLPIAETPDRLVALDLDTGARRFELVTVPADAAALEVLGVGSSTILLGSAGGGVGSDRLVSVDVADGAVRWEASGPAVERFVVLGGRPVAVALASSADPAAPRRILLGIGSATTR